MDPNDSQKGKNEGDLKQKESIQSGSQAKPTIQTTANSGQNVPTTDGKSQPGNPQSTESDRLAQIVREASNNEDGSISEKVQMIFVTDLNASAKKISEQIKSKNDVIRYEISPGWVPALSKKLKPCIIIASIINNTDVVKHLNFLKTVKYDVKSKQIKYIVLSKFNNPAIIQTFENMGCTEYIIEPISEKSLMFKMMLQVKALAGQRRILRQNEIKAKSGTKDEKVLKGKTAQELSEMALRDEKKIKPRDASKNQKDSWVFQGNLPKKQGGKWTMRMKGPTPTNGEWAEVEKTEDGESRWRFLEKDENGNLKKPTAEDLKLEKESGKKGPGWEFTGEKPQFNNGEWSFQGKTPNLKLIDEKGEAEISKVEVTPEGEIACAEDSPIALKKAEQNQELYKAELEKKKNSLFDKNAKLAKENSSTKDLKVGQEDAQNKTKDFIDSEAKKESKELNITESAKNNQGSKNSEFAKDAPKGGFNNLVGQNDKKADGKSNKELTQEGKNSTESPPLTDKNSADALKDIESFLNEDEKNNKNKKTEQNHDPKLKPNELKKQNPFKPDLESKKLAEDVLKKENAVEDIQSLREKLKQMKKKVEPSLSAADKNKNDKKASASEVRDEDKLENDTLDSISDKNKKASMFEESGTTEAGELGASRDLNKKNKKKSSFGLSEEEIEARKKEAVNKANKKRGFGFEKAEQNKIDEQEDPLDDGSKNFLDPDGKKEDDQDELSKDQDTDGGWSSHQAADDLKQDWSGKDSKQDEDESTPEDKLIEIDAPQSSFGKNNRDKEKTFEYPFAHFGDVNGRWELAGQDLADSKNRKVFVYVEQGLGEGKISSIQSVKNWWIYHFDTTPSPNSKRQTWTFRVFEPEKINSYDTLPIVVREYLKGIYKPPSENSEPSEEIKTKTRKPSPLLMAVLLSELNAKLKGEVLKILEEFCEIFAQSIPGGSVAVIKTDQNSEKTNEFKLISKTKSHSSKTPNPAAIQESLKSKNYFVDSTKDGAIYCPVKYNTEAGIEIPGVVWISPLEGVTMLDAKPSYVNAVAQCLRTTLASKRL